MALRPKVAAVLVMLLVALPVASSAACLLHRPQIASKVSRCQMLRHRAMSAGRQNMPLSGECCELSSGQALPPSKAEIASAALDTAVDLLSAGALELPELPVHHAASSVLPPQSGPNHQAVLCVFLI